MRKHRPTGRYRIQRGVGVDDGDGAPGVTGDRGAHRTEQPTLERTHTATTGNQHPQGERPADESRTDEDICRLGGDGRVR